ncbi:MAG: PKD domain-containing protein [Bacteroidota bacterium]
MKTKLVLFALGISLALMSCKKEETSPVSAFSFTVNSTKAPVTVSFINTSQNADTYLWNFGDGTSSSDKQPVHTYIAQGQYTIALEAKSGGKTNSSVQYITVLKPDEPLPAVSFSFTVNTQYAPSIATFTNNTTNAVSYSWNFGDGNTSTEKNPTHTYTTQGQYTITLEGKNGEGKTASATMSITVLKANLPLPVVNFTFTGNTAFAPCPVSFSNTTTNATSYSWNFGDNSALNTNQNPSHVFSVGGTYSVILTATNADGASVSLTKNVTVTMAPTKVNVKQLTLLAFPATTSTGAGWDIGSAADPYYVVSDYPSTTTYYTSGYFTDLLVTALPKAYSAYTISLNSVDANYLFSFLDDDGVWTPEPMGGIYFKFRQFMPTNGQAYPTELTITGTTGGLSFKLLIEWKP